MNWWKQWMELIELMKVGCASYWTSRRQRNLKNEILQWSGKWEKGSAVLFGGSQLFQQFIDGRSWWSEKKRTSGSPNRSAVRQAKAKSNISFFAKRRNVDCCCGEELLSFLNCFLFFSSLSNKTNSSIEWGELGHHSIWLNFFFLLFLVVGYWR